MAAVTSIIAGIGLAAGAIGTGVQVMGSMAAQDAQRRSAQLQRQAEATRQRAMDLDSQRKQYSIIREQQTARAQAIANATSGNAQFGSGLQGGLAQVSGQSGTNLQGVQQNTEAGAEMFAINGAKYGADVNASRAGTMTSFGQGISSLGGTITKDAGTISKIGGWN